MEAKFYFCKSCGNLMLAADASGVVPYCCGEEMTLVTPNTSDASKEKHVPVVTYTSKDTLRIKIGSDPHPMTSQHHISFVCVETTDGIIMKYLDKEGAPEVCVRFDGKPLAVYAYCNLHGMWRTDVPECEADGSVG